jgi:hypothetical protein
MKRTKPKTVVAFACLCACLVGSFSARAEELDKVNAYYLGNSYTGNAMPGLHPMLGESAGKKWIVRANISPGVPIWVHMKSFMDRDRHYKQFAGVASDVDAIVMLVYCGAGLELTVDSMFAGSVKFDEPTDVGDINSMTYIIKEYLKHNPKGRAYLYTAWPGLKNAAEYRKRVQNELKQSLLAQGKQRGEVMKKVKHRTLTEEEMDPLRKSFDYRSAWLSKYDESRYANKGSADSHYREHMVRAMEGLKKNFPEMWKEGRLGMVPVGDVFLEIDKKMKAGEVPGLVNVGQFSTDGGHIRSGLPRYVLAATYYAVLFRDHPKNLDYRIFNDIDNYINKKAVEAGKANNVHGFYVHAPDLGKMIVITPEIAEVINETIWTTVKEHPYSGVQAERN